MIFGLFKIRMLLSVVQLSLRSIHGTKLLKTVNLRSTTKCKYSTKWVSRKPVAIVNQNELFDTDDTTKIEEQRTPRIRRRKLRINAAEKEEKKKQKENEIEESTTKPKYIALDADDKLIRYIIF